MMMVVGVVFSTGQAGGIAGRDDGRLEAAGDIHDGREDVLDVGDPEVEGPCAEDEFGPDGVGQGDDPFVTVHGCQAGTADTVELDALGAMGFGQVDEFFRLTDADDFADQRRQVTVDSDIDVTFLQGADIDFRRSPVADAEHDVRADIGCDDASKAEGQATAQELFHNALPVAIGADAGAVIGVEDFVIGADGDDIQVVPDFLPFCRGHGFNCFVIVRRCPRQVGQEDIGQFAGQGLDVVCVVRDAEGLADLMQFFDAENRQVEAALGDEFQGQENFSGMGSVLGYTGSGTAQEVARYDEVSIGTADAARALGRNLAGPHVAVLAADTGQAEGTLRFLLVEAVEGCIAANLFHAQEHFPDCRVWCAVEDILLGSEGLAVFGDSRHVVVDAAVDVRMIVVMRVDVVGQTVMVMFMVMIVMMMVMFVFVFVFVHSKSPL